MQVLALDFDGVIVDSILDSLFVGHNAFLRVYGPGKRRFFGGKPFTFENWEIIKERYQKEISYYRTLRPYIRGATDYGIIQKIIDEEVSIKNQQEFDQFRDTVEFDFKTYQKKFYLERERLQKINYRLWYNLEPPYPKVLEGIKKFLEEGIKIVIATSNRREAIARSFTPEYFGFYLEPGDILDKRYGDDKSKQMQRIVKKYKVQFKDIHFIDDQISHLIKTKSLGVNVYLAAWSYATETQKNEAYRQNIPVMEREEDFYPTIRRFLSNNKNKE
ncbi:MAG: hypothetical protein Kow00103_01690 [Candidatus Caldatribacteriota bacterium]